MGVKSSLAFVPLFALLNMSAFGLDSSHNRNTEYASILMLSTTDKILNTHRYTFKVTIQVDGATSTLLECYSEPKLQKKAAQEHAAVGTLWCLKHLGYTPKP